MGDKRDKVIKVIKVIKVVNDLNDFNDFDLLLTEDRRLKTEDQSSLTTGQ